MDLKLSFPKRTGSVFLRGDFEFLQIHKTTSKRSLPVLFVIYETIRIVGLRLTATFPKLFCPRLETIASQVVFRLSLRDAPISKTIFIYR